MVLMYYALCWPLMVTKHIHIKISIYIYCLHDTCANFGCEDIKFYLLIMWIILELFLIFHMQWNWYSIFAPKDTV